MSIERGIVRVGSDLIEQGTKTHQSRRISLDAGTVSVLEVHHAAGDRASPSGRRHDDLEELRVQPCDRRCDALAPRLDVSGLPEDL